MALRLMSYGEKLDHANGWPSAQQPAHRLKSLNESMRLIEQSRIIVSKRETSDK